MNQGEQQLGRKIANDYFSFNGRLRRRDYLIRNLVVGIPYGILYFITLHAQSPVVWILVYVLMIPGIIIEFSLNIRRLHDLDASGWYCLLGFIPIADVVYLLFLFFKSGTDGPNRFGEDPKDVALGLADSDNRQSGNVPG